MTAKKKSRKKRHTKLTGLKAQLKVAHRNPNEPKRGIISKLEHGHTESQTVALLGLMEELGWDYNDLRERKAVKDARLAAGKYVLQQPIDSLFGWHEAEYSRAFSTRDDEWFDRQSKAIRAFKTGKLKPHPFDVAVGQMCEPALWANRVRQKQSRRWRDQGRGSYLADPAPVGEHVRLTAEDVANAKYPDGRPYFPIQYLAGDTIKVYERTFTGDAKRKAMSRFYDAICKSAAGSAYAELVSRNQLDLRLYEFARGLIARRGGA
jgi:hypothetical protein